MSYKHVRYDSDKVWKETKKLFNWDLPPPANKLYRLPVIRIFRFLWLNNKICKYRAAIGVFGIDTGYDDWVLYAVYRGWY